MGEGQSFEKGYNPVIEMSRPTTNERMEVLKARGLSPKEMLDTIANDEAMIKQLLQEIPN